MTHQDGHIIPQISIWRNGICSQFLHKKISDFDVWVKRYRKVKPSGENMGVEP